MNRITVLGTWALCASLSFACGGGNDRTEDDGDERQNDFEISETAPIEETGCLTASGDRYVLTALERGNGAETELYQLVGTDDELRQYVGREVRVTGDAEPAQVAELRGNATATPSEASGSTAGTTGSDENMQRQGRTGNDDPQVNTQTQTRLETRQLRVATVTPTGDECPAASGGR